MIVVSFLHIVLNSQFLDIIFYLSANIHKPMSMLLVKWKVKLVSEWDVKKLKKTTNPEERILGHDFIQAPAENGKVICSPAS